EHEAINNHPASEAHGREEQPALVQRQVPEALDEDEANRRPDEVGRHPDPAGPERQPEPRPPEIAPVIPHPVPRHVGGILLRRRRRWTTLDVLRRRWEILDLLGILGRPEAAHPLPSLIDLLPMAGHPGAARRGIAPKAADPDKVAAVIIPGPIAGN